MKNFHAKKLMLKLILLLTRIVIQVWYLMVVSLWRERKTKTARLTGDARIAVKKDVAPCPVTCTKLNGDFKRVPPYVTQTRKGNWFTSHQLQRSSILFNLLRKLSKKCLRRSTHSGNFMKSQLTILSQNSARKKQATILILKDSQSYVRNLIILAVDYQKSS